MAVNPEPNRHPPGVEKCLHCAICAIAERHIAAGVDAWQAFSLEVEALAELIASNHSRVGRRQMVAAVKRDLAGAVAAKRRKRASDGRAAIDIEDVPRQ